MFNRVFTIYFCISSAVLINSVYQALYKIDQTESSFKSNNDISNTTTLPKFRAGENRYFHTLQEQELRPPSSHFSTHSSSSSLLSSSNYEDITSESTSSKDLESQISKELLSSFPFNHLSFRYKLAQVIHFMLEDNFATLALFNSICCVIMIVMKTIRFVVFGPLRVSEQQHYREALRDYFFYKTIFVLGILGTQKTIEELLPWTIWFSLLGLTLLLSKLCKDRFEYLVSSPTRRSVPIINLCLLITFLLCLSTSYVASAIYYGFYLGIFSKNITIFLLVDGIYVTTFALSVVIRFAILIQDMRTNSIWETRASIIYHTDLFFELTMLVIEFCHHAFIFWGCRDCSIPSLIYAWRLYTLYIEIVKRYRKHSIYLNVGELIETNFSMATKEDIDKNSDDCAICWDKMESARKLPCGHLFHNSCLRSWLEQDTSCPTCRTVLKAHSDTDESNNQSDSDEEFVNPNETDDTNATLSPRNRRTFFHFDSSQYTNIPMLRWLPTISVDAIWGRAFDDLEALQHARGFSDPSSLDRLTRQVHELFPDFPVSVIAENLSSTQSVEQTVDNILERRLENSQA